MSRFAPTTPATDLTTATVTLPSATGFNAGDLVYYKDGDYKALPANALSTASFDVIKNNPTYQQPIGSTVTNRINGGGARVSHTDVLTNGNVVTAYFNISSNRPTFVITTPAGVEVIPATSVSTTLLGNSTSDAIGVVALSGGGFVVFWINIAGGTSLLPNYAIYDNAGVVVTAATQDGSPGTTTGSSNISGVALPNGGFALAYVVNTGLGVKTRAYNSIGVASFGWVTAAVAAITGTSIIYMAARSDSSYISLYQSDANVFRYLILSSTGTTLIQTNFGSTIGVTGYTNASMSVTTLANDTFVFGYNSYNSTAPATYYTCYRLLPITDVLSSESFIPPTNINVTQSPTATGIPFGMVVHKISSGGFFFAFGDQSRAISYAFFDNSANPISGTNAAGALVFPIPGSSIAGANVGVRAAEYNGNINLFWKPEVANTSSQFIQTSAISTTTFQLITTQSVSENLGTVTSPVNGVSNTTTPGTGLFLASASSTKVLTNSMGFARNATIINQLSCDSIKLATLSNGGFVVVYRGRSSPYPVTAVIYDKFGLVTQTIFVGNGTSGATSRTVDVTILTDGSLVISSQTGSNINTLYLYTVSGGVYTLSRTISRSDVLNMSQLIRVSISAITNNRFVFVYNRTTDNGTYYIVYDSSFNVLAGPSAFGGYAGSYASVNAYTGNGFGLSLKQSGGTYYNYFAFESGTNNFNLGQVAFGGNIEQESSNSVITPGNVLVTLYGTTASTGSEIRSYAPKGSVVNSGIGQAGATDTNVGQCLGLTGAGSVVLVNFKQTSTTGFAKAYNAALNGSSTIVYSSGDSYFSFTTPSVSAATAQSQLCATPGPGYTCILGWLDANNFPTYAILYAYPSTVTSTITSGVSISAPQPITAYSNQALSGYVLQGVAVTSAPAGGTGIVQTNGIAKLNNNYSSSNPPSSFDFQTPNGTNIAGVKGTAIGNTVILEGKA